MKKLVILAFVAAVFGGCEHDIDTPGTPGGGDGMNRWVYNIMKENYLWNASLPSFEASGANVSTQQYFDEKLRYRDNLSVPYRDDTYGDRFSHIEKISPLTRVSGVEMRYDAGFFPVAVSDRTTGELMYLQVCYVTPGSPADGKLKRGDAFRRINGTIVTSSNINQLLAARTMEIQVLDYEEVGYRTVALSCDGYYPSPIIADVIYEGRNTAYLAYAEFVMGGSMGPTGSASELRKAFGRYKEAGVRNLILDLRYNGGGELTAAQLLASLIARNSDLGKVFLYTRDNRNDYEPVTLLKSSDVTENADIETLIILTSTSTASASELIIHCLKPFFGEDMRLFGETTVGKNVGSMTYSNETWGWEMSPMSMMVYDKDKVSGYEAGIAPVSGDFVLEFGNDPASDSPFFDMGTLGNFENEHQLNVAMNSLFPDIPLMDFREGRSNTRSGTGVNTVVMVPEKGLSFGRTVSR